MAKRDYYEVLGVNRDAGAEEIKGAFRRLAMRYHPDRNQGDETAELRFKEINEAYQVLSDPDKRRTYNAHGHAAFDGSGFSGFADIDLSDLFGSFFGGGFGSRAASRPARGDDLRHDLTITFEEAFTGTEKEITVSRQTACQRCSGSGAEPGTPIDNCATCGGRGQVRRTAQSLFGQVVNIVTCPSCYGEGRTIRNPCQECHGQGRIRTQRTLRVRIPAGVDTGSQIRLPGEGEVGYRGGPVGDLYVVIRVKQHPHLQRREQDIYYELNLNIVQAALGDEVEVPTLEGPVMVNIPPGTQYGQTFRLKGRGFPHVRGGRRGDQYVVVRVLVPKDLSEEQRAHLRKVGGLTGRPERVSKGFFDKIREALDL